MILSNRSKESEVSKMTLVLFINNNADELHPDIGKKLCHQFIWNIRIFPMWPAVSFDVAYKSSKDLNKILWLKRIASWVI